MAYKILLLAGSLPLELNFAVSPINEHILTVITTDDEGFSAEDDVDYFIIKNTAAIGKYSEYS